MGETVVILVNYRGAVDTARCIQSLQTSVDPPAVVVVDNTPNDAGLEQALVSYQFVHVIRASENIGFGRANNLGIRWALRQGYKYIFILNNDTIVRPDTIRKLEAELDKSLEVGFLSPRIVLMENPEILWYGGGEINYWRGGAEIPGFNGPANSNLALQTREVSFVSGCAMFCRREALQVVGGFDPRYFMYEEDVELCLRASERNIKCKYLSTAIVEHVGQGSMRDGNNGKFVGALNPQNNNLEFYAFYFTRNRLLTMRRHAKGKEALMFIVGFVLLFCYKNIQFLINRRPEAVLAMTKGVLSFLKSSKQHYVNEIESYAETAD